MQLLDLSMFLLAAMQLDKLPSSTCQVGTTSQQLALVSEVVRILDLKQLESHSEQLESTSVCGHNNLTSKRHCK
jgi:hypothetical protein